MDPELVRPGKFAQELEITDPSLRRLMADGLPYIQVHRAIWIDRRKALAWLAKFEKRRVRKTRQKAKVEATK
jgi:hypothetical protein